MKKICQKKKLVVKGMILLAITFLLITPVQAFSSQQNQTNKIQSSTTEEAKAWTTLYYLDVDSRSLMNIILNIDILEAKFIDIDSTKPKSCIEYKGNIVPYRTVFERELFNIAIETTKALKCSGYTGIDIVYGNKAHVVDVNPRPTTAIFGLDKTMKYEIGKLFMFGCSATYQPSLFSNILL